MSNLRNDIVRSLRMFPKNPGFNVTGDRPGQVHGTHSPTSDRYQMRLLLLASLLDPDFFLITSLRRAHYSG
jgi:hypothetical protein